MFLSLLLAFAPAQQPVPDRPPVCHVEAARYVLRADPTVTARFHMVPRTEDWPWGVALEIRLGKTGRTSWWLPFLGGTSDVHGLRWTARRGTPEAAPGYAYNLRDLQYFAFDADYGMINTTPMRGDYAPSHILLNDLRDAFWYRDDPANRYSPPRSLFDLAGCADEAADGIQPDMDVVFPRVP